MDPPAFDFIFFLQKDENNYDNCILYNTKSLLNFMNRLAIDMTDVDIHFQSPFIIDNSMEPADLKQYISYTLENISMTTTEIMQETEIFLKKVVNVILVSQDDYSSQIVKIHLKYKLYLNFLRICIYFILVDIGTKLITSST